MAGHGRRRAKHAEGHENAERWLLTYADLITLLMVFFVVLYSMSSADSAKFKIISQALEQAFNVDVLKSGSPASISEANSGSAPAVIQSMPSSAADPAMANKHQHKQAHNDTKHKNKTNAPDVVTETDQESIFIRVSGSFLFPSGLADLKPQAVPVLNAIGDERRTTTNNVRVEGHTDNIPLVSPRYPTNWELSSARALVVTRYLVETGGVPPSRLGAVGFGEFRPMVDNDTREHRALNRRVEIHILANAPASQAQVLPATAGAAPVNVLPTDSTSSTHPVSQSEHP